MSRKLNKPMKTKLRKEPQEKNRGLNDENCSANWNYLRRTRGSRKKQRIGIPLIFQPDEIFAYILFVIVIVFKFITNKSAQLGTFVVSLLFNLRASRWNEQAYIKNATEEAKQWMKKGEKSFDPSHFAKAEEKYSSILKLVEEPACQGKLYLGRGAARYLQGNIIEGKADISDGKRLCPREGKKVAKRWKTKACNEKACDDCQIAEKFYLLALECGDESDEEFRLFVLEQLVDVQFQLNAFTDAIEQGEKYYWTRKTKSETLAERWLERGQQLVQSDYFTLAGRCYQLAMKYAPTQPIETMLKGFQLVTLFHTKTKRRVYGHITELRKAWKAALSIENFKAAACLLEEVLKCLQGKTTKGDEIVTEMRCYLAMALFQNGDYQKSVDVSIKILTISQGEMEKVISRGFKVLEEIKNHSVGLESCSMALKYFSVVHETLERRSRFGGNCEENLIEEALRGKTLTLLQMGALDEALENARLFVHQNRKKKEPALHTWLRFCLKTGNYALFGKMISKAKLCQINAQDKFGATLYHVAAQKGYPCQPNAIQILMENNANPLIKDNKGMFPGCGLSSSDPRKKLLQHVMYKHSQMELHNSKIPKRLRQLVHAAIQEGPVYEGSNHSEIHQEELPTTAVSTISQSKEEHGVPQMLNMNDSTNGTPPLGQFTTPTTSELENMTQMNESASHVEETKSDNPLTDSAAYEMIQSFENPSYAIICSGQVKDVLHARNSDVPDSTKRQIVEKIRSLAEGRRNQKLAKKLHHGKGSEDTALYEARLTKGQRIIWQEPSGFVPGHATDSQVIRVWKIVFQHDHIDKEAKKIVNSLRAPSVDVQSTEKASGDTSFRTDKTNQEGNCKVLLPVECSPNGEYHAIKKFYSMTKYMINNVLTGVEGVDYPFEVTELEQEIIDLKPSPECSIIVLGRSGTGKTTCCLYRLWNEFYNFHQRMAPIVQTHHEPTINPHQVECARAQANEARLSSDEITPLARTNDKNEAGNYFEQFHQIFISRNSILCGEIAKMFHSLKNGHFTIAKNPSANSLGSSWPRFLSVHQWLMFLDASLPGTTFFPRDQDGRLRCTVTGMDYEIRTSLQEITGQARTNERRAKKSRSKENNEPVRKMVTYEVFTSTLWPTMTQNACEIHPSLVWTEIMSFIKGSVDALQFGELTLEEYEKVGRKMAPSFHGNRARIYELYRKYKAQKKYFKMFDECDLVYNVYQRLPHAQIPQLQVDRFYVDEAQDLTQAELFLLLHCCRDPNGLFFSGDTAQTIMKGVSFRFEDLKSLFYRESQLRPVNIPDKIHQLTCNYRSHSGIVDLASSVVELLQYYFPKSIDTMEKEQGLFSGPKPVLIESCDFAYLRQLLKGQQRESSPIELGAHQVVLVASEKGCDSVPDELKEGLVMTVYEAKGLEFDDVLIFNFFKDSEAKEEWRVMANFGNDKKPKSCTKTRPLEFDEQKHKILDSELKHLYTAITRARANVWFYDEDEEARRPMFEFFQNFQLATTSDKGVTAKTSTAEEWIERGMALYKDKRWKTASTAFMNAGDILMAAKCKAQIQFAKTNARSSVAQLLKVAKLCIDCDMTDEAAVALKNAGEFELLRKLKRRLATKGPTASM